MDKQVMDSQVNNICEAYDCSQKATTKINVKVGQLGSIPLDLCIDCVMKFDDNTSGKLDLKQNIVNDEREQGKVEGAD